MKENSAYSLISSVIYAPECRCNSIYFSCSFFIHLFSRQLNMIYGPKKVNYIKIPFIQKQSNTPGPSVRPSVHPSVRPTWRPNSSFFCCCRSCWFHISLKFASTLLSHQIQEFFICLIFGSSKPFADFMNNFGTM